MPARDEREEERDRERATLHEVMELAAKFFESALQGRAGATARGYLQNRGLGPELQRRFRIGYAPPDRASLKEHLAAQNVTQADMIAAGLIVSGDDIPVSFDRFRDRVIFPIADFRGRIVGFGGRALSADVPAKYLNSPETELFHKGSLLYNGAEARKAAHDAGTVIAVEGYVDVIQMVGAGFRHTVAPLGTALTERQLQILWRMADEPILCFDGDKAGVRAAWRAADLALPLIQPGKSLRFALLPSGQDPDDLIRAGGHDAMAGVLAAARPLVDLIWTRETEAGVFDTPERRAALEAKLRDIAKAIADDSVRRHYVQAFAERVLAFFPPVETRAAPVARGYGDRNFSERRGSSRPFAAARSSARAPIPVSDRLRRSGLLAGRNAFPLREAALVMTVLNHPALLEDHLDAFAHIEFSSAELDALRAAVVDAVAHDEGQGASVAGELAGGRFGPLLKRLEAQIEAAGYWPATPEAADADANQAWVQALALHQRRRALHRELRDAEAALALDLSDENFARLADIKQQLARSEGTEALIEGFGAPSGRGMRAL
jgi:DNA primase